MGPSVAFPKVLTDCVERAKLVELYYKFVHSVNFKHWFHSRRRLAKAALRRAWLDTRLEVDITASIASLDEYERTDVYEIVQKQVLGEMQRLGPDKKLLHKLQGDLDALFQSLPKSLQQSIMLNPQSSTTMKQCYVSSEDEALAGRLSAPEETFEEAGKSPFRWFQRRLSKKSPDKAMKQAHEDPRMSFS